MTERDRVLDAFRNCITEPKCKDCPWTECETIGNGTIEIPRDLALAVMRELVAQEPRVMTYDDFIDNPNIDSQGFLPAWIEYRRDGEWGEYWDGEDDGWSPVRADNCNADGYRCWTSRPTAAEMEATPWN